jgi:hypothetical protein
VLSGVVSHPTMGDNLRYSAQVVGDHPDDQVNATLRLMGQYAREDANSPEIQAEAAMLQQMNGGVGADPLQLTCAVWQTVHDKIHFTRDEVTAAPLESFMASTYKDKDAGAPIVEILVRPRDMHTQASKLGDCDDFSMYTASLLVALKIPCTFVTLAGDPTHPQIFSHVYVAAYPNGNRVAMDTSHGSHCGWEASRPGGRKSEWPVNSDSPQSNIPLWFVAGALIGACCL